MVYDAQIVSEAGKGRCRRGGNDMPNRGAACRARSVFGDKLMVLPALHDGSQATCMQAVPHGGAQLAGTRQEGDLHRPQGQRQTVAIAGSRSAQRSHSVSLHLRVPRTMGQTNDPRAGPPPPGEQRGALRRLLPRWLPAVQLSAASSRRRGRHRCQLVCVRPLGAVRGCCTLLLLAVSRHTLLTSFLHRLSTCAAATLQATPPATRPRSSPCRPPARGATAHILQISRASMRSRHDLAQRMRRRHSRATTLLSRACRRGPLVLPSRQALTPTMWRRRRRGLRQLLSWSRRSGLASSARCDFMAGGELWALLRCICTCPWLELDDPSSADPA